MRHFVKGPTDSEPTLQDISDDVDRLHGKLDQALTQLEQISESLKGLSSAIGHVQTTLDEKDFE
jgi:hypothetical protein